MSNAPLALSRRMLLAGVPATAILAASRSGRAANEPIRIGTIMSVTGPASFLGEDMRDGIKLAVEEINAGGGIDGRQIAWTLYDSESQTQKAIIETKRLIAQDRVKMLVGGGAMSGIALAMAPMAEASKVPFISTEGASSIVEPVATHKYIFKSTVDDAQVIARIGDFFAKKGITKVALVADTSGFGQSAVEQMKLYAAPHKLDVLYESFGPTDTDMIAQLTRVRDSGAQAVICWTVTPAGVIFIKQAQQLGLDKRVLIHSYGFVSAKYMQLAGDAAASLLLVSVKFPVGDQLPDSDPLKPGILALAQKFEKRFGHKPNQYVAQTYDAMQLARIALSAGSTDPDKVAVAIEGIRNYRGTGGVFNFSPDRHSGLSKNDLVLLNWRDGRFNLADYA